MSLAHVITGAIAGAFVGGPPGAAVGGIVGLFLGNGPASTPHVSRAATAAEVTAAIQQNITETTGKVVSTEEGATTTVPTLMLSPDNALQRVRSAIDATVAAATAAGVQPEVVTQWSTVANNAERQAAFSLMMAPGGFRAVSIPAPPPGTPSNAVAALNATVADAMSALAAMDQAKAKGLAGFYWS